MIPPKLHREREEILHIFLGQIPFSGWTISAVEEAAVTAGYERSMALRAFPNGILDVVDTYFFVSDALMIDALDYLNLSEMPVRKRIRTAVKLRLEQKTEHREALRRLIGILTTPQYSAVAARSMHRTVDKIWRAAGDQSTDFNFYTKRILLAGVYSSTLLFWLNDSSTNSIDTWGFLDRRINDVMKIQSFRTKCNSIADKTNPLISRFFQLINTAR